MEQCLTRLQAFRATVESGATDPVVVTIAKDPLSGGITIRIRDRGGGISEQDLVNIWSYAYSTFDHHSDASDNGDALGRFNQSVIASGDGSSIAGLGYGLPLSRAYAEYFNGSLELSTLYGLGTDVYLKLKGVGVDGL
jgi:signal transduction histidine kinase